MTPEGVTLDGLRRLTHRRLRSGNRVFVLSYHSSSLLPGNTEYVRSPCELARFLRTIAEYLEFFMGEIGGISMTASELRATLVQEVKSCDCCGADSCEHGCVQNSEAVLADRLARDAD
jgi:hypothetical protein